MDTAGRDRSDAPVDQTQWMSDDEIAYWERVMRDPGMRAQHPSSKRAHLTRRFLRCYVADPRFTRGCFAFYRRHRIALTVMLNLTNPKVYGIYQCGYRMDWRMCRYWRDLGAFVEGWGLHLFEGMQEHIHTWMFQKRSRTVEWGDPELTLPGIDDMFELYFLPEAPKPHIGEVVRTRKGRGYVTEERNPVLHVTVDSEWDPTMESRASQRAWLMRECELAVDAELDRVADEAKHLGYDFPDRPHARDAHLQMLYQRVAYRRSCNTIAGRAARRYASGADRDAYNTQSIQKVTKDLADEMGFAIPRPFTRREF